MERLQKIIASAGVCSRRAAEELIAKGRVRVNGRVVTELGAKADPRKDKIEVDNKRIDAQDLLYLVLHKPRGFVSTLSDPEGRPTVADLIRDVPERLHPVGRLDFATSGVLLMTNDGELTNALLHPRTKAPKTYVVKLDKLIDDEELELWRNGIELEDGKTLPAEVRRIRNEQGKSWIEVTLREGRNHQIRRMAAATGFVAMRLARLDFAGIDSEGLKPGNWRPLTVDELRTLKRNYGVPKRVRPQLSLFRLLEQLDKKKKEERKRAKKNAPKRGTAAQRPKNPRRDAGRGEGAENARGARTASRAAERRGDAVRAERSDRTGTKPRGADRPVSRGPGRGRR